MALEFIPPVIDLVAELMRRAGAPMAAGTSPEALALGSSSPRQVACDSLMKAHAQWRHEQRTKLPKTVPASDACKSICRAYGFCVCGLDELKAFLAKLVTTAKVLCKKGSRTKPVVEQAGLVLRFLGRKAGIHEEIGARPLSLTKSLGQWRSCACSQAPPGQSGNGASAAQ